MEVITRAEAFAIQRWEKLVLFQGRGLFDIEQAVSSMLDDLSLCNSRFAVEQCIARFPVLFHKEIARQVKKWLSSEHPGMLFVFSSDIPKTDELLEFDNTVRTFGSAILGYIENPTGKEPFQIDQNELPTKQWLAIQGFDVIEGETCKRNGCKDFRIKHGVLCQKHHYDMLYGKYAK